MANAVLLVQQCDTGGALIPDYFVIKQLSGIRTVYSQDGVRQATLGDVVTGADVDLMMLNTGYDVTIVPADNFVPPPMMVKEPGSPLG